METAACKLDGDRIPSRSPRGSACSEKRTMGGAEAGGDEGLGQETRAQLDRSAKSSDPSCCYRVAAGSESEGGGTSPLEKSTGEFAGAIGGGIWM